MCYCKGRIPRKYDMKTNVLDISFLDEMATRPWFVQSLQQLCGDFFSRYVNAFKTSDSSRGFFGIFSFYVWYSTHCFICRPLDSTSKDAGIEPRTVATTALAVRRSNHSARSHPQSARSHPYSARSHSLQPEPDLESPPRGWLNAILVRRKLIHWPSLETHIQGTEKRLRVRTITHYSEVRTHQPSGWFF